MDALGRLKLLRGNLIVFYARMNSYGCLYNYRTGISVGMETHNFPKIVVRIFNALAMSVVLMTSSIRIKRTTCMAIEVLSDCVIIIQPSSVDVFELPEIVTRNDVDKPDDDNPRPVISARLSKTKYRPVHSEWTAGAIIPYAAPYPARRSTPALRPISILVRERRDHEHIIIHSQILCPPKGYEHVEPDPSQRRPDYDIGFYPYQVRRGLRPHFFDDIIVGPSSGRGLWLENLNSPNAARAADRLMVFSAVPSTDDEEWHLVDIGDASREGSVRLCARNFPEAVRYCSFCSFDDSVGRIVVASHDGRVRVLEMAPF